MIVHQMRKFKGTPGLEGSQRQIIVLPAWHLDLLAAQHGERAGDAAAGGDGATKAARQAARKSMEKAR